jgi:hypothetical protein
MYRDEAGDTNYQRKAIPAIIFSEWTASFPNVHHIANDKHEIARFFAGFDHANRTTCENI